MSNPNVERLVGQVQGYPDLRIPDFDFPQLPVEVRTRFPSMELWANEVQEQHRMWRADLQRALEQALTSSKNNP